MTKATELNRQLRSLGWTFDPVDGDFRSDNGRMEWEDVIRLVPGLTLDELDAWADDQLEQWRRRELC